MRLAFLDMLWSFSIDSNDKLKHPSKPVFLTDFLVLSQSLRFLHAFCLFEENVLVRALDRGYHQNLLPSYRLQWPDCEISSKC